MVTSSQPHPDTMHSIALLACASIAAIWAFSDFHRPFAARRLRMSVSKQRYILGTLTYVVGAVFIYSIIAQTCLSIADWLANNDLLLKGSAPRAVSTIAGYSAPHPLNSNPGRVAAAAIALLLLMMVPEVPGLAWLVIQARRAAQALAYFPETLDRLLIVLSNVPYKFHKDAERFVAMELGRFGVEKNELLRERAMSSAVSMAAEIASIRVRIRSSAIDPQMPKSVRAMLAENISEDKNVDLRYARFLRHLGNHFLVLKQLRKIPRLRSDIVAAHSRTIEDEGSFVVAQYRRFVGEVALSRIWLRSQRIKFLHEFGYDVPAELALPFWPIVTSFLVTFGGMIFLQGVQFALHRDLIPNELNPRTLHGLVNVLAIVANQAIIQSIAILWALAPKKDYAFARPSLKSMPVWSYLVYGLCSFTTSVVFYRFTYFVHPDLPFARIDSVAWYAALGLSFQALNFTICVAVLTDVHLMGRRAISTHRRITDGVILAISSMFVQIGTVVFLSYFVFPRVFPGGAKPVAWRTVIEILSMYAAIGFAIGVAVPATASVALRRIHTIYQTGFRAEEPEATLESRKPLRAVINLKFMSSANISKGDYLGSSKTADAQDVRPGGN